MIEFPSVVYDLDEKEYHAHKSLSSTGAKLLLQTPALFDHVVNKGNREDKKAFDYGTAVHAMVLGTPSPIVAIPEDVLAKNGAASTAAAKEFIENARADGLVPLKEAEVDQINAVTESVLANDMARYLFEAPGDSEVSVFAEDPETGVRMRCRFDRVRHEDDRFPQIALDLKTVGKRGAGSPIEAMRTVARFGYGISRAHYTHVADIAGFPIAEMAFVFVEMEPPYLVSSYYLDDLAKEKGAERARRARQLYAHGLTTGQWPGYSLEMLPLSLAPWEIYED